MIIVFILIFLGMKWITIFFFSVFYTIQMFMHLGLCYRNAKWLL